MNQTQTPRTEANCSPVFSMSGVMPGASEMAWKTAYPNPDAGFDELRPSGHGPSFSMAGVMPGSSQTAWHTAMPDPTRDMLDGNGYVIAIAEFEARAAIAARPRTKAMRSPTRLQLRAPRASTSPAKTRRKVA